MATLTYERLHSAVAGDTVAIRSRLTLDPAGGPGDKVFPPTYATNSPNHKYADEDRNVGDRVSKTVLLDSVASQANRAELALLAGWEDGDLIFPVPYVDFTVDQELADIGKLTVLEAPHRTADAIFRDSLLEGTLFRLSETGRAITDATPKNATALFQFSPSALLFGMWDSTGPKGGLGSKFQRAFVSEIVGLDVEFGKKVGSRIDPLGIEKLAPEDRAFNHEDPSQVWTLDPLEAATTGGKPVPASRGSDKGDAGQPSKINHGNIAPSIDAAAGGVTIGEAVQTTVISLAALRRLRFAGHSNEASIAARAAVAALGVAAIAYQYQLDFDLRSRCLLIPRHAPQVELVGRNGEPGEIVEIDRQSAGALLRAATTGAAAAGIGWNTQEVRLEPAPKLVELIKRSRKLTVQEQPASS
jgi:CRISPR-associated protein Csb1